MSALRKTRILYVNHTGQVSGAEKILLSILRGLDHTRYEPYVLCPPQGELAREVRALGAEWLPWPVLRARFTWRPDHVLQGIASLCAAVISLRRQLRTVDPNLIHANSVRAGIAASMAAIGTRKPVIWHVHDTLPRHPVSTAIRIIAHLTRNTRVVAVSHATAKRFSGLLPFGTRVRTIYNGVDLNRFSVGRSGQSAFREHIGVPEDDFLVCSIGQICARKGLRELVDAMRQIHPQAPNMHLAIVGKVVFQHEEAYLHELCADVKEAGLEGCVHLTGELANVSPALQAADLLVLNSRDEPFGLVLIEAMASGTPVLATRVGGVPEIVSDSENGWLIANGDTAALSSKLLDLSQDRSALTRVAQTAHRTTCPQFSLERFQNELIQFYAELDPNSYLEWKLPNPPALARGGKT